MNYIGLNKFDTANGEGIRVSLFVSGCRMHCKGCFNKESWDFNSGKPFRMDVEGLQIIEALDNYYVSGLSILGGEPLDPENQEEICNLLKAVKELHPDKDVWLWTGKKIEQVKDLECVKYVDVLVVNPFIEHLKVKGKYYGSSNQRVMRRAGNEWVAEEADGASEEDPQSRDTIRIAEVC